MYNKWDLDAVDLTKEPPLEEPARQRYFMAKCREWTQDFARRNNRAPTASVQTFGCPKV